MKERCSIDPKHIDVIDGIRAISVMIVVVFHFWQQTWIDPVIKAPWLSFIKIDGRSITSIDFTVFARAGYIFVDMLVLLSAFLISLPLMRCLLYGEELESAAKFYRRRTARILPSYLLAVLVTFLFELFTGGYSDQYGAVNTAFALRDLFTHLTFTNMLRIDTYIGTRIDVVLWTLAVEVWFYLLFPLICRLLERSSRDKNADEGRSPAKAVFCVLSAAVVMIGISHLYIYKYVLASGNDIANFVDKILAKLGCTITSAYITSTINQLPAFLEVYAVGMLGALLYTFLAADMKRSRGTAAVGTLFAFAAAFIISKLVYNCALSFTPEKWQVTERLRLSCVFMFFIISSAFAARWFRFLLSNRLMRFMSAISYNLYIWHQWIAVKFKYFWRLPNWKGTIPPNQLGDTSWSIEYAIIITLVSLAVAVILTYLFEKPCSALIMGRPKDAFRFCGNKKAAAQIGTAAKENSVVNSDRNDF